jgi:lysyl endopeptidase
MRSTVLAAFICALLAVPGIMLAEDACSAAQSSQVQQKIKVGDVYPFHAESKHPYDNGTAERNVVWRDVVSSPGAKFVRVHFNSFDLKEGDYVTVSNPSGTLQ